MARTTASKKENKVTFVCDDRELAMVRELAAADDRAVSDWLRRAVRQAHAARFGEQPEPARKAGQKGAKRTARKP